MKKIVVWMQLLVVLVFAVSAEAVVLGAIEADSPSVWDIDSSNGKYVPKRGGIKVCKAENILIVGFYLSHKNMNFYKQTFSDNKRKPLGFEIDIIDHSKVFDRDNLISRTPSRNMPNGVLYDENYADDNDYLYSIGINDPTKLQENTWYFVTFQFAQHANVSAGKFEVQAQLVGNIRKLKNDYPDLYDQYGLSAKTQLDAWFLGVSDKDGNNFFNVRKPVQKFRKSDFFNGYDRVLWSTSSKYGEKQDFQPGYCGFGSDPWSNNPIATSATGFNMCYDQPESENQLSGWAKFWKKVRSFFFAQAEAACAQHESIEGTVQISQSAQTVTFIPDEPNQMSALTISMDHLPNDIDTEVQDDDSWHPTTCDLKIETGIFDIASGAQIDNHQGYTLYDGQKLNIHPSLKIEGSDAKDCRVKEHLQTVETAAWVTINGSKSIIRDADGDRYQTTKMKNLKVGKSHGENIPYTVHGNIGDHVVFDICADVNEDLNDKDTPNCSKESFTITAKPVIQLTTSNIHLVRKDFVYAGDHYGLGATATNSGNAKPYTNYRMNYQIKVDNTWITIDGDTLTPQEMTPGYSINEQMNHDNATAPTQAGNYQIRACIANMPDSCSYGTLVVKERPKPILVITQFRDKKGCCTTNRGKYLYPRVWVKNIGPVAPSHNVRALYQINSRGTGYQWWTMGYGTIEPRELQPSDTDEDRMDQDRWRIPKSNKSAWKKTWHTIRVCIGKDGSEPTCNPATDAIATYGRYSKK